MNSSINKRGTGFCFLSLLLLCVFANQRAIAAPHPPGMIYREDVIDDVSKQIKIVDRLKQIVNAKEEKIEKEIAELAEEQMEVQALLDAKARSQREQQQQQEFSIEDTETLPVPAAIYHSGPVHSGKRTSYMALCHFKICNMGRKRQL